MRGHGYIDDRVVWSFVLWTYGVLGLAEPSPHWGKLRDSVTACEDVTPVLHMQSNLCSEMTHLGSIDGIRSGHKIPLSPTWT